MRSKRIVSAIGLEAHIQDSLGILIKSQSQKKLLEESYGRLIICQRAMAGVEGLEPSPTVLETDMLPITPNSYRLIFYNKPNVLHDLVKQIFNTEHILYWIT